LKEEKIPKLIQNNFKKSLDLPQQCKWVLTANSLQPYIYFGKSLENFSKGLILSSHFIQKIGDRL